MAGPPYRKIQVHSTVGSIPFRVSHHLSTARSADRVGLPWSFPALQRHPRTSPILERDVPFPPRFRSQAFSTSQRFPGKFEFHGLISCRNRSWTFSFRVFPHKACDPLSRIPTPAQFSTDVQKRTSRPLVTLDFPKRPRRNAVAWFPRELWAPFPPDRSDFPVTLEDERFNRSFPPASPTSKSTAL